MMKPPVFRVATVCIKKPGFTGDYFVEPPSRLELETPSLPWKCIVGDYTTPVIQVSHLVDKVLNVR